MSDKKALRVLGYTLLGFGMLGAVVLFVVLLAPLLSRRASTTEPPRHSAGAEDSASAEGQLDFKEEARLSSEGPLAGDRFHRLAEAAREARQRGDIEVAAALEAEWRRRRAELLEPQ